MKLNITTVLLLGVLGIVAWKLLQPGSQVAIGSGAASPSSNPYGGTPPAAAGASPDLISSIVQAVGATMGAISNVSQAVAKSN